MTIYYQSHDCHVTYRYSDILPSIQVFRAEEAVLFGDRAKVIPHHSTGRYLQRGIHCGQFRLVPRRGEVGEDVPPSVGVWDESGCLLDHYSSMGHLLLPHLYSDRATAVCGFSGRPQTLSTQRTLYTCISVRVHICSDVIMMSLTG